MPGNVKRPAGRQIPLSTGWSLRYTRNLRFALSDHIVQET